MKLWLVTIGEPVPVEEECQERLHRTGRLATLAAQSGHHVTWWTSTFDHIKKKHWFAGDTEIQRAPGLEIRLLHGCGYRSNVSLARFRDHRQIAAKFAVTARQAPEKPDVILCALPTIELCVEAVRFGREFSVPVVLDMRDMWPDIFVDTSPWFARPLARMLLKPLFQQVKSACAQATAITGITDSFVKWGLNHGERPKSRLDESFAMGYINEPPSAVQLSEAEAFWDRLGLTGHGDQWIVCFFGTLGRQFDLDTVLQAARRLQGEGSPIRFVLCGQGDRLELYKRKTKGLSNVVFPGWVNAAAIHVLMRRSALGLDPLPNRYDFLATINNKAIEYLSAGLPIVSSPTQGVLAELLAEQQCGVSYENGQANELAALLTDLNRNPAQIKEMSVRAAQLFQTQFTAEKVYAEMLMHLESLSRSQMAHQGAA